MPKSVKIFSWEFFGKLFFESIGLSKSRFSPSNLRQSAPGLTRNEGATQWPRLPRITRAIVRHMRYLKVVTARYAFRALQYDLPND
jgi:hypothetical protein